MTQSNAASLPAREHMSTSIDQVHLERMTLGDRRLEREEFVILSELHKGKTLSRAIEPAFRGSSIDMEERPSHVQRWFHAWAALGWFSKQGNNSGSS